MAEQERRAGNGSGKAWELDREKRGERRWDGKKQNTFFFFKIYVFILTFIILFIFN